VLQVRQKPWRNVGVVLQESAFGDFVFGPEQLLKIGEMNLRAVDFDVGFGCFRGDFEAFYGFTGRFLFDSPRGAARQKFARMGHVESGARASPKRSLDKYIQKRYI